MDEWRGRRQKAAFSPWFSRSSQTQLKTQNSRIEQLFQKVAQQQRHLEKQHLRIQHLQSQVPPRSPPGGEGGRSRACGVCRRSRADRAARASQT